MRLEHVTAEIRPRSELEAVDLGLALVRRDFWRCLAGWWLALAVPTAMAGWYGWDHPGWLLVLFWWGKPAGSRMVLFQLSRRLFGEQPSWNERLRELPRAWSRRFIYRFCRARFSPFMPVTLAVEDLEGLRGLAYQQRVGLLLRRGGWMLATLYLLADLAAGWFGLALFWLVGVLMPDGQDSPWTLAMEEWDPANPFAIPLLPMRTLAGCLMVAMSLTDLFVTGAGFGLYVNARTWIEGWDVELAFRRLGQRLVQPAVLLVLLAMGWLSLPGQAAEPPMPAPHEAITAIKEDPDFKVHKVTQKVRKMSGITPLKLPFGEIVAWVMLVAAVGAGGWFLGVMLWQHRDIFARSGAAKAASAAPQARVVMGLPVTPESLPGDVPAAVWSLWQADRRQEALGLLYRGTISRVIERERVAIQEADTEGDCLRRVELAGEAAFPAYFRGLTRVWMELAYAGRVPGDEEIAALCHSWPFAARRSA